MMARYQLSPADVKPFLRRKLLRSLLPVAVGIVVGVGFAFLWGGSPVSMVVLGFVYGLAVGVVAESVSEYLAMQRRIRTAGLVIELTVTPDELLFATEHSETKVRRLPGVRVEEAHGAFVVTAGGASPVLVPIRHLSPEEREVLRGWAPRAPEAGSTLAPEIAGIRWPPHWVPVETPQFEARLTNEVGPGHVLYGRPVRAIGRRLDTDDVLFYLPDGPTLLAVVRLTYSERTPEPDPRFPYTTLYASVEEWIEAAE